MVVTGIQTAGTHTVAVMLNMLQCLHPQLMCVCPELDLVYSIIHDDV